MLEALRKAAGTWVAKALLVLLVASFAVWGISGSMINGAGGGAVVRAGDTEVSAVQYRLAYDRQLAIMSRQFGMQLTREQATAMGIDEQVISQLVGGAVLDEQGRQMGLGLSKDKLAALTAEDPAFQGPDGKFDRNRFVYVLNQVGMPVDDYFADRANVAMRQQIIDATTGGLRAPDTFLKAVSLYQGEDRTVEFLAIPRSSVEPIAEPADDVLKTWFGTVKPRYAAPEYRKISYVRLEPQDVADPSAITEDQIKEDYERNKARYTTPETRTIEQLVFPSMDAAKAAHASLATGKTFDQLMADQNKTAADVLMGTLAKDKVPDPAIGEAAFAIASAGQVSEPVQGTFGAVLVRVTAITPEVVKSLADVSSEIRTELANAEASRVLLDVHDSYEDARAGGETLQQAADKLKLKVVTIDAIDRTGARKDGSIVNDIPASADLLRNAFEAEVGMENASLNSGASGYVFFQVDSIEAARERELDEVKAKAIADWKLEQANTKLDEKVKALEQRVKDGSTLDALATELSLEKQTKRGLKRGANDADFGENGVGAVFDVGEGGVGQTPTQQNDGRILFKVTEVFEAAGADADTLPEQQRNTLSTGIANDMLDEMINRLRGEFDVEVDRAAAQLAIQAQR